MKEENDEIEYINNQTKKKSKKKLTKKREKKHQHPIKRFFIKLFIFSFIIAVLASSLYLAFKGYLFKKLCKDMFNNTSSIIYDTNKNTIAKIGAERNRENIDYKELPQDLIDSYISIEDKRYFKHIGIDVKRTGGAIFSYVIHRGNSSFGGSTITQQLVKNLTGNDKNTASRKIKEWFYSLILNFSYSKEEILEAYFNIIYTGPNIYGVKEAALYYFDKDISNLNLEECAFLAGINNSPNSYNPFSEKDRTEKIRKRTKTVLNQMYEQEYITKEEYDAAVKNVEQGLNFKQGKIEYDSTISSYHSDAVINEVISDLQNKYFISKDFATNYFCLAGTSIYSTVNKDIQSKLETELKNSKYVIQSQNNDDTSQSAIVVIDISSGNVVGCVGGLGEKKNYRSFNRVTQMKRQTGSAMKPIAVLAPSIDKKMVTNVTIISDEPTTFIDYNNKEYNPIDYDPYRGSITLRQAVETSQNIPFVKIMETLTPQVSIQYLKKMGITSLNDNDVNLSLALGGLDIGISPLEFAGAYNTIANDGIYIEPTFYSKIDSFSGELFMKSKQRKRKVFSKDVACVLKHLLIEPVKGEKGTATYCSIDGIDVAAKTGTTNENYDRWLCGFTPYYTSVCWYGFDTNESIDYGGKNPAGLIWSSVMNKIHTNLPKKTFDLTSGVETAIVCKDSGKLATPNCKNTYKEYFLSGTKPEQCTIHNY